MEGQACVKAWNRTKKAKPKKAAKQAAKPKKAKRGTGHGRPSPCQSMEMGGRVRSHKSQSINFGRHQPVLQKELLIGSEPTKKLFPPVPWQLPRCCAADHRAALRACHSSQAAPVAS
eukprot:1157398-Pelagomonas_calceolata.AAC.4